MPDQSTIAQLIEQLPATDRELQQAAERAKAAPDSPAKDAAPAKADEPAPASKVTGPDPAVTARIFEQILAGGRNALEELVAAVRVPAESDFRNYKASYLLHGLIVQVGRPDQDKARGMLGDLLATKAVEKELPLARRIFFVRELRWIASDPAIKRLGPLLNDPELCADAAAALVAIGPIAAAQLREALPQATGRCRLTVIQTLGQLRDATAAEDLRTSLQDEDLEVRLLGGWALARIADGASTIELLKIARQETGYGRSKAVANCLLLAEGLEAAGKQAEAIKVYQELERTSVAPQERYLRELSSKALGRLEPGKKAGPL